MTRLGNRMLVFCAALTLGSAPLSGQAGIPDTPAGRALRAWLDAYNSGDSARAVFFRTYDGVGDLGHAFVFRQQTGGFDLLSIEMSEPRHIEFMIRARKSPLVGYGALDVMPGDPFRLGSMLLPLGPNVSVEALRIDDAARRRVIGRTAALLDSFYVLPDVGRRMRDSLHARLARGVYDRYVNGAALSIRLQADLDGLAHDKHLRVLYTLLPVGRVPPAAAPTPAEVERKRPEVDEFNCGFQKVERLDGNVGYLRFDSFDDPAKCEATVAAAMTFVAGTRALIIDLRENGGGNLRMPGLVASYFFDHRTHLDDVWNSRTDSTLAIWTRDSVVGLRYGGDKPVYILTSAHTASGAEAFAYDLQAQKRATIVGEATSREAHPTYEAPLGDHFGLLLPSGNPINSITGTNWEGAGVVPDVKVPASEALAAALRLLRDGTPQ